MLSCRLGGLRRGLVGAAALPVLSQHAVTSFSNVAVRNSHQKKSHGVIPAIVAMGDAHKQWRHHIHQHPEVGFQEFKTSAYIADKLKEWGLEVTTGVGKTGVVGTLRGQQPGKSVGLRADMDALGMTEENEVPYKSLNKGVFHGCGHDGHCTMLLAAAHYLSQTREFAGTVHFIFQPAEEGLGGALAMLNDGLFERFPCDKIFAIHNWPDLPTGSLGVRAGPIMASCDEFSITIRGQGGHAAMPHHTVDPVVIGSQVVTALQTLVSRVVDPLDSAVVSVTKFHAGSVFNVIPECAHLGGTVRAFNEETRVLVREEMKRMVSGICSAMQAEADVNYIDGEPSTVNAQEETKIALQAGIDVIGADHIVEVPPAMVAEDFAHMLRQRPGCYVWLGQAGGPSGCFLHNPKYDFNDSIVPIGASWFVRVVKLCLPLSS